MEDVMRVVFGRMTDENNWNDLPAEEKIKLVSINTFIVPGELKLADVNEILELNLSSDEMTTIGGWLLEQFGFLPTSGTVFKKDNIIFTAEDVSMRRIVSVRIQK
jgi:putative hemolysin